MRTIRIQTYHRATGKPVEEPFVFGPTQTLIEAITYMVGYIVEGNEMTEQEVREVYRFEIVV